MYQSTDQTAREPSLSVTDIVIVDHITSVNQSINQSVNQSV